MSWSSRPFSCREGWGGAQGFLPRSVGVLPGSFDMIVVSNECHVLLGLCTRILRGLLWFLFYRMLQELPDMRAFHILDFSRSEALGWNIFMDVERPAIYEAISTQ